MGGSLAPFWLPITGAFVPTLQQGDWAGAEPETHPLECLVQGGSTPFPHPEREKGKGIKSDLVG